MFTRRTFLGTSILAHGLAAIAAPVHGLAITQVGDIPITPESPAILFTAQEDFVHGRLSAQYRSGYTQLLKRHGSGSWVVAPGVANQYAVSGGVGWTVPFRLADAQQPETMLAVLVKDPLPPGLVITPARWRHVMLQSEPVEVSGASFDRSHVRVIEVGGRIPLPGIPVPVANYEEVKIATEGVPRGAMVQLVVQPTDNSRRWPSSHIELIHDTTSLSTAYFGRTALDPSAKGELDVHSRFWLYGVVTTYPLPIRPQDGIDAPEWLKLTKFLKAISPKLNVVRAVLRDEIRVRITRFGESNDGANWLATPIQRVEGTFTAGPRYIPSSREIVTLLVRAVADKSWRVAGAAYLTKNRAYWMLPAADLQPVGTNPTAEFVAIAVVSFRPFDPSQPVTEADLRARQVSISDEVLYRFMQDRR